MDFRTRGGLHGQPIARGNVRRGELAKVGTSSGSTKITLSSDIPASNLSARERRGARSDRYRRPASAGAFDPCFWLRAADPVLRKAFATPGHASPSDYEGLETREA